MPGDFVCTSANDGTHLFRPITARAHTLWQEKGFINYVIDNKDDAMKVSTTKRGANSSPPEDKNPGIKIYS